MIPSASPKTMPCNVSHHYATRCSTTTGLSMCPATIQWCGWSTVANCRSAGPAAMRRCPIDLGLDGPAVLAVGGELKNTFCLTDGARAYLSGHIGDMETLETLRAFERAVGQLSEIRHEPVRLAADLHPGYHTRSWAERRTGDRPLDLIQHHHAHVVSLLAEHGRLGEPVIGVSFDGTGYGLRPNDLGRRDSQARTGQSPVRPGRPLAAGTTAGRGCGRAESVADGAVSVMDGRNRLDTGSPLRSLPRRRPNYSSPVHN